VTTGFGEGTAEVTNDRLAERFSSQPWIPYLLPMVVWGILTWTGGKGDAWNHFAYPMKTVLVLFILVVLRKHYDELYRGIPSAGVVVVSILAGMLVLMEWVMLEGHYPQIPLSSSSYDPLSGSGRLGPALLGFRIFGAVAVVPFMEELLFRSFLWRWIIAPDFRSVEVGRFDLKAFSIVVALFGLEHARWLPGLIAGIVYGWLVWRYRSLWPAIIAHAVTNAALAAYVISKGAYQYW